MEICRICEYRRECNVPTNDSELHCLARRTIAENVRELRKDAGLTQFELASRAGINRSYLARLESEAINISVNVLFSLAKSLNVDPPELLKPNEDALTDSERRRAEDSDTNFE